jgi:hypothetical protein
MRRAEGDGRSFDGSAGSISAPRPPPPRVSKYQVDFHQPRSRQTKAPRPPLLLGRLSVAATSTATPRVSKTEIIHLETGPAWKVTPRNRCMPNSRVCSSTER